MLKKTIGMGGFTLAEVLITLGIIGVVAAMTMPTLINSTNGAQYKTAFKKSLSVLSQAVVMNIALNDYDLAQISAGTNGGDGTGAGGSQSLADMFRSRLNVVKEVGTTTFNDTAGDANEWVIQANEESINDYTTFATNHVTDGDNSALALTAAATEGVTGYTFAETGTAMFMSDGIVLLFDNTQANCQKGSDAMATEDEYCFGFIDVNGQKGPNKLIQCNANSLEGDEGDDDATCNVSIPTDIYPIAMYDQSVIPASAAARTVLYSK